MRWGKLLFPLLFFFLSAIPVQAMSIQDMITAAQPGSVIHLPPGVYEEKLSISRPIHLIGSTEAQTIIEVTDEQAAIEILTDRVILENITIIFSSDKPNAAAIYMNGNQNELKQLDIQSAPYGIYLDDAHENLVTDVKVTGDAKLPVTQRKHRILVWESNENTIKHSEFSHVQDGIYIENSAANHVHNNTISHTRYGVHLMFTNNSVIENNESFLNISGLMIMGTEGTIARHNYLHDNQRNIQSLGLLLFDVENATVTDNIIHSNRIGVFIENAFFNELTSNSISSNYIGMQFLNAKDNMIHENAFVGNIVQAQVENSGENDTDFNYWDNHQVLDRTGNGVSDLPYEIEPFLIHLTDTYPPFQLLFNAPGMLFLEQLMETPEEEKFIDAQPLLENPLSPIEMESSEVDVSVWFVGIVFLIISSTTIYLGVKKS